MVNEDEYITVVQDELLPGSGEIFSALKEATVTQ